MQRVRAALNCHIDGRTGGKTVLRVESISLNLKLRQRICRRRVGDRAVKRDVRRTVQRNQVAGRAVSAKGSEIAVGGRTCELRVAGVGYARRLRRQIICRAFREREFLNLPPGHHRAGRHRTALDQIGASQHIYFRLRPDFQSDIQRQTVFHVHVDVFANRGLKTFLREGDVIFARQDQGKAVTPAVVSCGCCRDIGFDVFKCYLCARNQSAVGIGHRAGNRATKLLRLR